MTSNPSVRGWAEPGYESCFDAFRANFDEDGELGAACAVYLHGRPVLDVWGGVAVRERAKPWRRDTVALLFSVTKGVAALCILALVERGLIRLDRPVCHYWPQFGSHGKDKVTVREALGHRAGVPLISGKVTIEDLADPVAMAARLADEQPLFEPGTAHAYHAITIGWITSELVRRVTGQSLGEWFHQHIAGPLSLGIGIGRGRNQAGSVAVIEVPLEYDTPEIDPESLAGRALGLNGYFLPRMTSFVAAMNDPAIQQVELAGVNGLADARSLAKLYAATLDRVDGCRLLSAELIADACSIVSQGTQWDTNAPGPTWGAGLMLPWAVQPMLGPGSFGHDGAGGSLAFAHAPSGVSFAYVRNRAGQPNVADPAVYRVVGALADRLDIRIPHF